MENNIKFGQIFLQFWTRIFDYKSVSSVKEYWITTIFQGAILAIGFVILGIGTYLYNNGHIYSKKCYMIPVIIIIVYSIASILPWIALNIRRLHDTGKSGWWTLLVGLVGIGLAILLLLCSLKSRESFDPFYNENVSVYGPPELFNQDIDGPRLPELSELDVIPIEVYGPPEFFEEDENDDDQ